MSTMLVYPVGSTEAIQYAVQRLQNFKIPVIDHPAPEITHLLLDVPSFTPAGSLRGGGEIERILERIPEDVIIVGGNLDHPAISGYRTLDLLKEEAYVAENAAITADCALKVASPMLKTTFRDTPTLIIGWGRIGKCLAQMLQRIGADVTVAARKESDRAMLRALGYKAVGLNGPLSPYRLVFNTVPAEVYSGQTDDCIQIDLASGKGLSGENVLQAKGLPGVHAPESSGKLIAATLLRLCEEDQK